MSDLDQLTRDLDLDVALARTYELHDGLVRRAATRRRFALGGGLATVAIALAVLIPTLGGDGSPQGVGVSGLADGGTATTATTIDSEDLPDGYSFTIDGDLRILTREPVAPETTTSRDGGAVIDVGSAAALQRAAIVGSAPGADGRSVVVDLACVKAGEQIEVVRYRVEPARVVVDAELGFDPAAAECAAGAAGQSITLPLPGAFVPGTPIVAEPLHTP